jgi:hypothetical protein
VGSPFDVVAQLDEKRELMMITRIWDGNRTMNDNCVCGYCGLWLSTIDYCAMSHTNNFLSFDVGVAAKVRSLLGGKGEPEVGSGCGVEALNVCR